MSSVLVESAELAELERSWKAPAPWHTRLSRLGSRPGLLVGVVYALVALLADFPIYPGDPSRLPTFPGGDIVQTAWFLAWTPYALLHGHNLFVTNFINFPNGVNLAQNTGIPLLGLVSAPLTLLAGPVASMNLLRWVAFWLSAYAAYAVIRKWVPYAPAAFVGGLLYGFSPYMAAEGSLHLNLIFVPLPPVILYLLYELLIEQRRSPVRTGILLGLSCVAQFYIESEVLATTLIVAMIGIFFFFFACIAGVRERLRHGLIGLAIGLCVVVPLIAYPVWILLHGPAHYVGAAQGAHNVYSADLLGPIVPSANQLLAPAHLKAIGSSFVGHNPQENGSYLGIPLIVLLIVIVARYWRRLWPVMLAMLVLATFVFSLGPQLIVDGVARQLPISLPFHKFTSIPVLNSMLPVRFALYVTFFVAVLLAYGIDAYRSEIKARHEARRGAALSPRGIAGRVSLAVLALASAVLLLPNWPYRTLRAHVNPTESPAALSMIPTGATVLAYPYPTAFSDQAMLWQALDKMRFRLLGSYALVPDKTGHATSFPTLLSPPRVESMLVNSSTDTPDPDVADDVATSETIKASRISVLAKSAPRPVGDSSDVVGRIASVSPSAHELILDRSATVTVGVAVSRSTLITGDLAAREHLGALEQGDWAVVSGTVSSGSVTPKLVRLMRVFLARNHVDAVVDDLGLRDSWQIGLWIDAAIGRPNRAGGGGEIWIDVPARLRLRTRSSASFAIVHSQPSSLRRNRPVPRAV